MRTRILENIDFDFRKPPPYKRYERRPGGSRPSVKNPKKDGIGGGLSSHEEKIVQSYEKKIANLQSRIDSLKEEIKGIKWEMALYSDKNALEELERMDDYIVTTYGNRVLDILASGIEPGEKIEMIDRIIYSKKDIGIKDIKELVDEYNDKIEFVENAENIRLEKQPFIDELNSEIKKLEKKVSFYEKKIYNIYNY